METGIPDYGIRTDNAGIKLGQRAQKTVKVPDKKSSQGGLVLLMDGIK